MYVKKEYAESFFEATSKNFLKKGVYNFTDMSYVDAFQEQLNVMAKEHKDEAGEIIKYEEGEKILPSDLTHLKDTIRLILEDMKKGFVEERASFDQAEEAKMSAKERANFDPLPALMAVTDYLYAMAMKTLGCPDIPESFGSDVVELIEDVSAKTELEMKESEYLKTDVDRRYEIGRAHV